MRRLLRSRFILHLIAAVVFPLLLTAGLSCNAPAIGSPYMPIPPPTFGPATQEIDSDGVAHTNWKVTGPASPELPVLFDIYVYLTNIDMGPGTVGSIARTAQDGSYATRIEGQQGDRILFNFGSLDGESMCRPLREGVADTPCQ